ncbi:MAG: hypothetical protein ACHQ50_14315, partial [Fimbriimonadales bacterium]
VILRVGNGGRTKNEMYSGMLRWRGGPFSLGLEWMHDSVTNYELSTTKVVSMPVTKGDQLALSAKFDF